MKSNQAPDRTRLQRRKEFLRAVQMLQRVALTQTDYSHAEIAKSQLGAAYGRVLELYDEAVGVMVSAAKGASDD